MRSVKNPPKFLEWLDDLGVTYFASGSNHPGEILGLAAVGINPGATVNELKSGALEAIRSLAGTGIRVFMDSGAFSEVSFGKDGPYVKPKNAISDEEWHERLNVYNQIAQAIGPQAYLVAPDKVAFQQETFERQDRYAGYIQFLADVLGANVLVPLQKGELSLFEAMVESAEILNLDEPFIPSIPMKKDATSIDELQVLLEDAIDSGAPIGRLHLLGLGPRGSKARKVIESVLDVSPQTEIYMDSVLIRAIVGRSEGIGGGPRLLTVTGDAAMFELGEAVLQGRVPEVARVDEFMDRFDDLAGKETARRVRREYGSIWEAPPDVVMDLHSAYIERASVAWRKAEAIKRLFGADPELLQGDWRTAAIGDWSKWIKPSDFSREFDWLDGRLVEWIYHPTAEAFYPPKPGLMIDLERALKRSRGWRRVGDVSGEWMYVSRPTGPEEEWVVLVEKNVVGAQRTPVVRVVVTEA